MTDHVFVGPSLDTAEVEAILPGAVTHHPVRHGDLLRLDVGPGDRVLIVDGLFMQIAPVRHREILGLLERGVVVAGSSSMGALRAAELHRYGMRGVGRVFELYRDGVVTGDDEVAVVYGPAEDGYPLLSEPLVDLRIGLERAVAAGVVTAAGAARVLDVARAMPFRMRGRRALARAAAGDPTLAPVATAYLDWSAAHRVDAKAEDARALLCRAASGPDALPPAGATDRPVRNVATSYRRRWVSRHVGLPVGGTGVSDADVGAVLRTLHPDLPAQQRLHVLSGLTGVHPASPDLEPAALQYARSRGVLVRVDGGERVNAGDWLSGPELTLPAQEAALRVLTRAVGSVGGSIRPLDDLPEALLAPEVVTAARRLAGLARALQQRLPRPDPTAPQRRLFFRADTVDAALQAAWGCPAADYPAHCWDRGFLDVIRARAVAEPLVALLVVGASVDLPRVTSAGGPATPTYSGAIPQNAAVA